MEYKDSKAFADVYGKEEEVIDKEKNKMFYSATDKWKLEEGCVYKIVTRYKIIDEAVLLKKYDNFSLYHVIKGNFKETFSNYVNDVKIFKVCDKDKYLLTKMGK